MSCIHMVLKQFVHSEGGCANRTLVREMSRFQTQTVILHHVTEQFPLMNLIFKKYSIEIIKQLTTRLQRSYKRCNSVPFRIWGNDHHLVLGWPLPAWMM
jgi:hypothetical protein